MPRTRRWGIAIAAITAVVSGFAVFVNGYGVRAWRDAGATTAEYTTAKNLVAAAGLLALLALATRRRPAEGFTRPRGPGQWTGVVAVGIVGGSVPFLLFFEGLARAGSGDAAFIHKTLVVWVALLAVPLLGERLSWLHLGAIGLLLAGQFALDGGIEGLGAGSGELMILAATLLWALEVVMAKRLLVGLSSLTLGVARMGIGVVVLISYVALAGSPGDLIALGGDLWLLALGAGAVLTLYVATWYAALARAQAVDVTAVLVPAALITALLRTGFDGVALPDATGVALLGAGAVAAIVAGMRRGLPTR